MPPGAAAAAPAQRCSRGVWHCTQHPASRWVLRRGRRPVSAPEAPLLSPHLQRRAGWSALETMKIDHLATMWGCSSAMSDVGPKGTFDAVAAQRRMEEAGVCPFRPLSC